MKKYLIAGILVWLPLGVTVLVIKALVELMDKTLLWLPPAWQPQVLFGVDIPGLGVIISVVVVFLTGVVVANFLGRALVRLWEKLLARIPLAGSVYSGVKQIVETLFSSGTKSFRKVIMVEYPRKGTWCLGFQTGTGLGEVQAKTGREVAAVFIPTTPNPTSGFVLMVPVEDIIELDMSVDEGLKMIISMGVVVPNWPRKPPAAVARPRTSP